MKKSIHVVLLILILVLPSFLFSGGGIDSENKILVRADEAKVRFKASPDSLVVGIVIKGDIFIPEKTEGEWYRISFLNKESGFSVSGYINKKDIEVQGEKPEIEENLDKLSLNPTLKTTSGPILQESIAPDNYKYSVSGKITYTTTDLKFEYEIIDICVHYQEFGTMTLLDPLENAINKGVKNFEKKVIQLGGDAVVGFRFEFANRTQKDEGRLLIYGTVIKFK